MTTLTPVLAAIVLFGLLDRRGFGRALALSAATPVGAAAVLGGFAVPTFYTAAIVATGLLLLMLMRGGVTRSAEGDEVELPPVPGSRALALLVIVATLITFVSPLIFNGLPGLRSPGGGYFLVAGLVTKSNAAQIIYLVLSVSVVGVLARNRWAGPQIMGLLLGVVTVLSFWAWVGTTGAVPFPVGFFDNSPFFAYIETSAGGAVRPRGIFSEPSGLAASCLATIAYSVVRLPQVRGLRMLKTLVVLGMAVFLGWISTSATFFVAGAAAAVVAALIATNAFVVRQRHLSRLAITLVCAAAVAALWLLPLLANTLGEVISGKTSSASYSDRSGLDDNGYQLVLDTYGLGTGLGSNRASSFIASSLSTIGIPGVVLLAVAVLSILRAAWPLREVRPVVWALITFLVAKAVAGPDLADSTGVLWISLGILAHAGVQRRAAAQRAAPGEGTAPPGRDPSSEPAVDPPDGTADAAADQPRPLTPQQRAALLLAPPRVPRSQPRADPGTTGETDPPTTATLEPLPARPFGRTPR